MPLSERNTFFWNERASSNDPYCKETVSIFRLNFRDQLDVDTNWMLHVCHYIKYFIDSWTSTWKCALIASGTYWHSSIMHALLSSELHIYVFFIYIYIHIFMYRRSEGSCNTAHLQLWLYDKYQHFMTWFGTSKMYLGLSGLGCCPF